MSIYGDPVNRTHHLRPPRSHYSTYTHPVPFITTHVTGVYYLFCPGLLTNHPQGTGGARWMFGHGHYQSRVRLSARTHRNTLGTFSCSLLVAWLLNVPATCNVYFRDRSAWTIVRAATLRLKMQIKLSHAVTVC